MSALSVEEYIKQLFHISPKKLRGTASVREWLEFIEQYNHCNGQVVLNQAQRKLIQPYCTTNEDLEMTPDDFIRLIHLVRDQNKQLPQVSVSTPSPSSLLFSSSRPRSSKVVNDQPTRSAFSFSQKQLDRNRSASRPDYTTDFYDDPEQLSVRNRKKKRGKGGEKKKSLLIYILHVEYAWNGRYPRTIRCVSQVNDKEGRGCL
jgi:hypothetical protein